jgi:hypothetical protein
VESQAAYEHARGRPRLAAQIVSAWAQLRAGAGWLPPVVPASDPPPAVIVPPEPEPAELEARGVTMLLPRRGTQR